MNNDISDEELDAITSALKLRYGIDFTGYERKSLKRGFARAAQKHNLTSTLDLWSRLLRDKSFLQVLIDELTVNLTDLFRNAPFWHFYKNILLERFKNLPRINILHAGCSTGEEVYSNIIMLNSVFLTNKSRLTGIDLSSTVVSKAEEGTYSIILKKRYEDGFNEVFPNQKFEDYFDIDETNFKIKKQYKSNVLFKTENLVTGNIPKGFDIIFCRNVLIYFDEKLKTSILQKFHEALNPNGIFIVGYYDLLPSYTDQIFKSISNEFKVFVPK